MRGVGHRVGRGALSLVRLAIATVILLTAGGSAVHAQDVLCDVNDREVHLVRFEGNATFSSDELLSRVVVTPSSLTRRLLSRLGIPRGGARRCLPETGLAPDVANLLNFYRLNGFYDTRVDTAVTGAGQNIVDVTFRISEGPPLILDTLMVTGLDSVADWQALLRRIPLRVGQRAGTQLVNASVDTMTSALHNAGYPRAEVLIGSFVTHRAEHRVEVGLDVHTGAFARIGTIAVNRQSATEGRPPSVDSSVVLGLLPFRPGDAYRSRDLVDAQNYLYSLGLFRHVGIDTAKGSAHGDSLIDIAVDLQEDLMRQFDQEEGWGTLDCFHVSSQYTDKNFQNKARRLTLTGRMSKLGFGDFRGATPQWTREHLCDPTHQMAADSIGSSKVNDYFGATIQYPTLFGTRWTPAYSVYTERRGQYKSYLRTIDLGGSISATRQVRFDMPLRLGYSLEHGAVQADNAILCGVFNRCSEADRQAIQERQVLGVASVALQRNRTDNPIAPTRGYNWATEYRTSSGLTATDRADQYFNKGTFDGSTYKSLSPTTVLALRARFGYIQGGTSDSTGTRLPPPQERLYAGGANSVRGFQQNELGPQVYLLGNDAFTDTTLSVSANGDTTKALISNGKRPERSVPSGGNALVVLNAEVRFRGGFLPNALEVAPFVDAGQVWVTQVGLKSVNKTPIQVTPGVSFRYFWSFAPILVNLAYNGYPPAPGTAYFAQPVNQASQAPLICVSPDVNHLVPFTVNNTGTVNQPGLATCPASYIPPPAGGFFQHLLGITQHLVLSLSIGTDF